MKLLLFGGAFDPPHSGHRALLCEAIKQVSPDLTLVMPSKISPHKQTSTRAFKHRRRMCRIFLDCGGRVRISSLENRRRGASYTIDTVRALLRRRKDTELYLLVGTDMLDYFEKWKDYEQLLKLCVLVAGGRTEKDDSELAAAADRLRAAGGRVIILDNTVEEISSTQIRNGLTEGIYDEHLLPDTVKYIKRRGLYKK